MSREVLRFEHPKLVPAPPALRDEHAEPRETRPLVVGTSIMHAPVMTYQERCNMEAMPRDLHDAHSKIAYHHHNISDMS